ncbi:MAG: BamA/TamA family outer membrane protein, partial [Pseudomonadota bacterium]|nr:BamA/TamA family outer membrane protein [Pseudomonadota bacterium]
VLDRFSEKLSETGYFDTATVRIGTPNNQNIVPVEVHVIEHPRKKINASIGYNSDIGPQFNINYLDLDLRHSTWQFNPSLNIARQLQNYNLNFLLPRAQPGLSYAITSAFSHSNIQNNDLKTLVLGGSRIQKNNGNEHILSLQLYFDRQSLPYSPILISKTLYLSYLIHIFRINNRLWPSRGYYISMGAGISQQGIISDQSFIREHIKGMWFIPFLTTNTLILRGEIGAIESRGSNGIPPTLLYITGGGQSVRGYAYNSLGINENGAIVGGKFLTIASAEADHWFTPKWAGAVFYDAGNASNRWHMPLKKGAGIGARWRSPVGAVSIDIAHGFESGSSYRFNLSVGYSF